LDVPADRFQKDIASEEIGFDADGWYRIRFAILFPEWEGSSGGDNIWFTLRLQPKTVTGSRSTAPMPNRRA